MLSVNDFSKKSNDSNLRRELLTNVRYVHYLFVRYDNYFVEPNLLLFRRVFNYVCTVPFLLLKKSKLLKGMFITCMVERIQAVTLVRYRYRYHVK